MDGTSRLTLSTHVLDTERGVPAAGVEVILSTWSQEDDVVPLFVGQTGLDGRIRDFGEGLRPGHYQLFFNVAEYFGKPRETADFLTRVLLEFRMVEGGGHYHVPLLLSRFSCTSYRGS